MLGQLSPEQIELVLRSQVVGRIGCQAEDRIYVVPISYAYDGEYVYAHSGDGMKLRALRARPAVCFEVEQIDDLANWRSVIAWGTFEEPDAEGQAQSRKTLLDRFMPLMTSVTAQPTHGMGVSPPAAHGGAHAPIFFRLRLTEKTGRFEKR